VLKEIPVRVITNDKTALLGAGRVAALSLMKAQEASR
jgi:glucokinase